MISNYNTKQILLIPFHLILGLLGFGFCWLLVSVGLEYLLEVFDIFLPPFITQNQIVIINLIAGVAMIAAAIEGWKMWRAGKTQLPGILSAVPDFSPQDGSSGRMAGTGRFDMIELSVQYRIIANIVLSGPIQILNAWQRIRNVIPDTRENADALNQCLELARKDSTWQATDRFAHDYQSMFRLIRMGHLEFSPTKGLVQVKTL